MDCIRLPTFLIFSNLIFRLLIYKIQLSSFILHLPTCELKMMECPHEHVHCSVVKFVISFIKHNNNKMYLHCNKLYSYRILTVYPPTHDFPLSPDLWLFFRVRVKLHEWRLSHRRDIRFRTGRSYRHFSFVFVAHLSFYNTDGCFKLQKNIKKKQVTNMHY